jgi:hypothetical protein
VECIEKTLSAEIKRNSASILARKLNDDDLNEAYNKLLTQEFNPDTEDFEEDHKDATDKQKLYKFSYVAKLSITHALHSCDSAGISSNHCAAAKFINLTQLIFCFLVCKYFLLLIIITFLCLVVQLLKMNLYVLNLLSLLWWILLRKCYFVTLTE